MSLHKGKFIVFEGLDGAGTSTQMVKLRDWLSKHNIFAELTKEPSNGPFGALIRQAIEQRVTMDSISRALAFASDRMDHISNDINGIQKSLNIGHWVLCDRYVLSNLAYQSAEDIDLDWLLAINHFAIEPALTIFFDTSMENCIKRIDLRSSHMELFHNGSKLEKALLHYRKAISAKKFIGDLITINGNTTEEEVFSELIREFKKWLENNPGTGVELG
jgi:thymidylate kinase